jgi:TRAP-type mannitol/chloroaromatic compound transport system permease small subunit
MTAALLRRGSDILEAAVDLFGRLAAYVCVALVLLVAANVLARYFFRAGTIWLQEFEWHLISPIALLGMSYTMLKGEQVRVDFLFDRMPGVMKHVLEIATGVIAVIVAVIIVRLSLPFVEQSYRIGERSPNPGGLQHRWLLKAFIPLGFTLLALQGIAHSLRHTLALVTGSEEESPRHPVE